MENLNTSLTLILILLMILLLFCLMQNYIYNSQPIRFIEPKITYNQYSEINKNDKNNESKLIEIKKKIIVLINLIKDSKENDKNNFEDIPVEDIQTYYDSLKELDNNVKEFETLDMVKIKKTMDDIKLQRMKDKEQIVNELSNLYVLLGIDHINKGNAISYNEFLKYQNPKKNIYYQQYL